MSNVDWALATEIRVAWGDMDAFGHVNNAVYLRWFETARIEWLALVEFPEGPYPSTTTSTLGPMLKTVAAVYEAQVKYPDVVVARVRAEPPGRTSVKLVYEIESRAAGRVVATGESVVVLVKDGRSEALPDDLRVRITSRRR